MHTGTIRTWLPESLTAGLDVGALLISEDPAQTTVEDLMVDPERDDEFLAYALLARALRQADQAGTRTGSSQ